MAWTRRQCLTATPHRAPPAIVPPFAFEDGQRVSERRETYRATFSAGAGEYLTELDEATWRRLRTGSRYRLKISTLSGEVKEVTPLRGSWR